MLHARTESEVTVRAAAGTVHLRVSDRRPDRGPVRHGSPYSGTGQGLPLVARLSSRHGVETGDDGKTVWCELRPGGPPRHPDAWECAVALPGAGGGTVTLLDVPTALYAASQQHRHALPRELTVPAGPDPGVPPEDLAVAQDTSNLITAAARAYGGSSPVAAPAPRGPPPVPCPPGAVS